MYLTIYVSIYLFNILICTAYHAFIYYVHSYIYLYYLFIKSDLNDHIPYSMCFIYLDNCIYYLFIACNVSYVIYYIFIHCIIRMYNL